eukprot:s1092_g4.t1
MDDAVGDPYNVIEMGDARLARNPRPGSGIGEPRFAAARGLELLDGTGSFQEIVELTANPASVLFKLRGDTDSPISAGSILRLPARRHAGALHRVFWSLPVEGASPDAKCNCRFGPVVITPGDGNQAPFRGQTNNILYLRLLLGASLFAELKDGDATMTVQIPPGYACLDAGAAPTTLRIFGSSIPQGRGDLPEVGTGGWSFGNGCTYSLKAGELIPAGSQVFVRVVVNQPDLPLALGDETSLDCDEAYLPVVESCVSSCTWLAGCEGLALSTARITLRNPLLPELVYGFQLSIQNSADFDPDDEAWLRCAAGQAGVEAGAGEGEGQGRIAASHRCHQGSTTGAWQDSKPTVPARIPVPSMSMDEPEKTPAREFAKTADHVLNFAAKQEDLRKKALEEAGRKVCFLGEGSSNKSDCEEKRQADRDRKVPSTFDASCRLIGPVGFNLEVSTFQGQATAVPGATASWSGGLPFQTQLLNPGWSRVLVAGLRFTSRGQQMQRDAGRFWLLISGAADTYGDQPPNTMLWFPATYSSGLVYGFTVGVSVPRRATSTMLSAFLLQFGWDASELSTRPLSFVLPVGQVQSITNFEVDHLSNVALPTGFLHFALDIWNPDEPFSSRSGHSTACGSEKCWQVEIFSITGAPLDAPAFTSSFPINVEMPQAQLVDLTTPQRLAVVDPGLLFKCLWASEKIGSMPSASP